MLTRKQDKKEVSGLCHKTMNKLDRSDRTLTVAGLVLYNLYTQAQHRQMCAVHRVYQGRINSSTLTVVSDFTLCVRSGYPLSPVHAPESPLRLSQSSRSPVVFIRSLHANYCNQTQVFLILHLTHLLTAVC